jgi:hypothetical protein
MLINYYADIDYNKSKINDYFYVGYIINKEYYIIDSIQKDKTIKTIGMQPTYNNNLYIVTNSELVNINFI